MDKYLSYIFTIFLTILATSALFLMILFPLADPLVYSVQPFSIDKENYKTHDTMIITSYRCNNEAYPLATDTKERYFFNVNTGTRYDLSSSPGVIQVGCSWQDAIVINGFPEDMPSGRYVKRGITVANGRFRTVDVPWITRPFEYEKVD